MSDGELRDLHRRFVAARGGAGMRYDAFVSTLSQRVPDILKQRQASEVCFDVEVRDGKAIVKGRPKR